MKICQNCNEEMNNNCIKYCSNKCAYEVIDIKAKEKKLSLNKNKFMKRNKIYNWLAWKLPAGLVLWCYIRVVALSGDSPTDSYKKEYDLWVNRYNLKRIGF